MPTTTLNPSLIGLSAAGSIVTPKPAHAAAVPVPEIATLAVSDEPPRDNGDSSFETARPTPSQPQPPLHTKFWDGIKKHGPYVAVGYLPIAAAVWYVSGACPGPAAQATQAAMILGPALVVAIGSKIVVKNMNPLTHLLACIVLYGICLAYPFVPSFRQSSSPPHR